MTAQVLLMNRLAVALASDSVISMRQEDDSYRTRASSEKILPLFGEHDVVFMTSGLADVHPFPIQVLIWEWSKTLRERKEHLNDYLESFLEWLAKAPDLRTSEREEASFSSLVSSFFEQVWRGSSEFATDEDSGKAMSDDDFEASYLAQVRSWCDWAAEAEPLPELSRDWAEGVWRKHRDLVRSKYEFWFDDRPQSDEAERLLRDASRSLAYWYTTGEAFDIVVAGFGANDLLPHYVTVRIHGVLDGRVRRTAIKSFVGDGGAYHFFGQFGASVQFIMGIDDELRDLAVNSVERLSSDMLNKFAENHALDPGGEEFASLTEQIQESKQQLGQLLLESSERRFRSPLMQVIELSPEADLANMAKSLIEIQAIRQSIDEATPTVGGPIDVAIVSKVRGFRWVQHKSLS